MEYAGIRQGTRQGQRKEYRCAAERASAMKPVDLLGIIEKASAGAYGEESDISVRLRGSGWPAKFDQSWGPFICGANGAAGRRWAARVILDMPVLRRGLSHTATLQGAMNRSI